MLDCKSLSLANYFSVKGCFILLVCKCSKVYFVKNIFCFIPYFAKYTYPILCHSYPCRYCQSVLQKRRSTPFYRQDASSGKGRSQRLCRRWRHRQCNFPQDTPLGFRVSLLMFYSTSRTSRTAMIDTWEHFRSKSYGMGKCLCFCQLKIRNNRILVCETM